MDFTIIFQDRDLIAVDKPSGWTVYPEDGSDPRDSILPVLREEFGPLVFPVHRLDKGTSGVLLFCRSPRVARELQELFEKKIVDKVYHALVYGEFLEPKRKTSSLTHKDKKTQSAKTEFSPLKFGALKSGEPVTVVRCNPHTGRFHQIRKHLKSLGFPIVGEGKDRRSDRLMLHASSLTFRHPRSGKMLTLQTKKDPVTGVKLFALKKAEG